MPSLRTRLTSLLPAAVSVATYVNGLHGDWLDDDPLAITQNADVACPGGLRELFAKDDLWRNDFWGTPMSSPTSHLSYRPLTILSFRLQHCLHGFDGPAFHAVNVALHALVVVLFMHVMAPLIPPRSQRQAAALLFAVHAVHVEVVTGTVRQRAIQKCSAAFMSGLPSDRPRSRTLRRSAAPSYSLRSSSLAASRATSGRTRRFRRRVARSAI